MSILRIIRPLSQLVGMIHAPFSHKKVCAKDYLSIRDIMMPGDILISRTRGELTNLFIPGEWKHAAIVSFEGNVIEAVGTGVRCSHIFDFLRTKDRVALIRTEFPESVRAGAVMFALSRVGNGYDYEFESGDHEYYCSELVNLSYQATGHKLISKKGRVYPSDFEKFRKLYESAKI